MPGRRAATTASPPMAGRCCTRLPGTGPASATRSMPCLLLDPKERRSRGGDVRVRDSLGRREAAAGPLSADRRPELIGEGRDHTEPALRGAGPHDEVTIRNVLERLGPPQ